MPPPADRTLLQIDETAPQFGAPFVDLFVRGIPVTQGSVSRGAHGNMFSDHHAELLEWRNQIERTVRRHRRRDSKVCVEGPVVVSLTIVVERGSHPKWRAFPIGREAGGTDVDKLERAILDGFARTRFWIKTGKNKGTEVTRGAEAISDDGNVVGTAKLKVFTNDEHPDPGCRLRVWTVDRDLERAGWLPVPDWPGWRYVHRSHL